MKNGKMVRNQNKIKIIEMEDVHAFF